MGDLSNSSSEETYFGKSIVNQSKGRLSYVDIEEGIQNVGDYAFYNDYFGFEIHLPSTIFQIGVNAFYGCNLLGVEYNGDEADWLLIDIETGNDPLLNTMIHFTQLAFVNLPAALAAKIRESSSLQADVLVSLPGGTRVTLIETENGWSKVRVDSSLVGYAESQQITTNFPLMAATAFILPAQTSLISEQAFAGVPIKVILIPDTCTEIQSKAFEATGMTAVYLHAGLQSIASDAFPKKTVIFAPSNSYAAEWATNNSYLLVPVFMSNQSGGEETVNAGDGSLY